MSLPKDDAAVLSARWIEGVLLKRDVFSTVERGRFRDADGEVDAVLRRLDQVPPWSFVLARHLFARERHALALAPPPATTALGSLLGHITGGHIETVDAGPRSFQPMNINFGLFPPLATPPTKKPDGTRLRGNEKTVAKKQAMSARALSDLDRWIADHLRVAAAA